MTDIRDVPQGKFDYPYQYTMLDKERGAFDLGWEYRRRGLDVSENPFHPETEKWRWFREGWQAFKDTDFRRSHGLSARPRQE